MNLCLIRTKLFWLWPPYWNFTVRFVALHYAQEVFKLIDNKSCLALLSNRENFYWLTSTCRHSTGFHLEILRFFCITEHQKLQSNWRLGTCKFVFFMLFKTDSPGDANIETDDQRYSQTSCEFGVCNINGRAVLPGSTVNANCSIAMLLWYMAHNIWSKTISLIWHYVSCNIL